MIHKSKMPKINCTINNTHVDVIQCTMSERSNFFVTGPMKPNLKKGTHWTPKAMPRAGVVGPGGRRMRRWHPGTQVLHKIRHYQRTTKLCIPKLPFLLVKYFYVISMHVEEVEDILHKCNVLNGMHVRDIKDTCMCL